MGQNTVPLTAYFHLPLQVSDAKSGPGVLQQPNAQPIFFQQQTVPIAEEFEAVPIPLPYPQQTVSLPEERHYTQPVLTPHPYQIQTVPTPEEYDQETVPHYEEQPPIPQSHQRDAPPSHPASSTTTLSSPSSIEKPQWIYNDLDENGFTAEERLEHQRTIKRLHALRWVMFSRWFIRIISVLVSLISFILIMITVVLFLQSGHRKNPHMEQDVRGQFDNVDIRPSAAFASIGGIFTIISLAVNVGCCFSKKVLLCPSSSDPASPS
jgi:hypothetical protein